MIGDWIVDVDTRTIQRGVESHRLEPRPMEVLLCLANAAGQPLSVEEIKSLVWGQTHVVDDVVKRCISQIRVAFGDTAKSQTIIRTTPKRGYSIACNVKWTPKSRVSKGTAFHNAMNNARIRQLGPFILAGLLVGSLVLFSLFSSSADRPLSQSDRSLTATKLLRANDYYSRYSFEDNESAIAIYRDVLSDNPRDARAHAGLANALLQRFIRWGVDNESLDEAHQSAKLSIELNRDRPEGHKALGLYYHTTGQSQEAINAYKMALAFDDASWTTMNNIGEVYRELGELNLAKKWFECSLRTTENREASLVVLGELYFRLGAYEMARAYFENALTLTPFSEDAHIGLSLIALHQHQPQLAQSYCTRLLEVKPDVLDCQSNLGLAALLAGDFDQAASIFQSLSKNSSRYWKAVGSVRYYQVLSQTVGFVGGDEEDLGAILDLISVAQQNGDMEISQSEWLRTLVFAAYGDSANAMTSYEAALRMGHVMVFWDSIEPGFYTLRKAPRFEQMLREAKANRLKQADELLKAENLAPVDHCSI